MQIIGNALKNFENAGGGEAVQFSPLSLLAVSMMQGEEEKVLDDEDLKVLNFCRLLRSSAIFRSSSLRYSDPSTSIDRVASACFHPTKFSNGASECI